MLNWIKLLAPMLLPIIQKLLENLANQGGGGGLTVKGSAQQVTAADVEKAIEDCCK